MIDAIDKFITLARIRNYSIIFISLGVLTASAESIFRMINPAVRGSFLPDFLPHWTGGKLLLIGKTGVLFDPAIQHGIQVDVLGPTEHFAWFVSLPIVAALYAPFAAIDYNLSAVIWLTLNMGLLIWCVRSLQPFAPKLFQRHGKLVTLASLASAPVLELVGSGQDTAFMLATWIIGMKLLARQQDSLAGAVFGLAALKPQHAVLIPFVLLTTRRYKALAAFATVSVVVLSISTMLVGIDGMRQWMSTISSPLFTQLVQQGQTWKMTSLPAFLVATTPPDAAKWLASNLTWLSVVVGFFIMASFLRRGHGIKLDTQSVWVATLATTLVFSSHLLMYDTVLFLPVALFLLERRPSAYVRVMLLGAFTLTLTAPMLHVATAAFSWPFSMAGAPWSALPLAALWLETIKEARIRSNDDGVHPATTLLNEQAP